MSRTGDKLRRWADVGDGYWFAPKLFGLGATPVTWQGWAVTLGGIALVLADMRWIEEDVPKGLIAATIIVAMVVIAWRKTDGGWRWRWGVDDE